MLVAYSNVNALDAGAVERLKVAMRSGLACTDEAANHGYVMFEGKCYRLTEVNSVIYPRSNQILFG